MKPMLEFLKPAVSWLPHAYPSLLQLWCDLLEESGVALPHPPRLALSDRNPRKTYPSVMVRCAETEFDTARMRTDLTRDLATERQGIEGHR
jgi:hypothetical protein